MNEQKAIIFNKKQSFLIKLNKIISRVYFENARKKYPSFASSRRVTYIDPFGEFERSNNDLNKRIKRI